MERQRIGLPNPCSSGRHILIAVVKYYNEPAAILR
jgi:hypothetical protein